MSNSVVIQGILTTLISAVGLWMAIWVYRADNKSKSNRYLSLLILLGISFIFTDYIAIFTRESVSLQLERVVYSIATFALGVLYVFSLNFPKKMIKRDGINYVVYALAVIYVLIFSGVSSFSNLIINTVVKNQWGVEITGGQLEWVYIISSVLMIALVLLTNITKYATLSRFDKQKERLFLLGIATFIMLEAFCVLILPLFGMDKYSYIGDYSILVFFGLTAYAIVKHHLLDIRLALVRSATYSLVLATLAGIYLVIAFAISAVFNSVRTDTGQMISGVAVSLVLAFVFQPIRRFFDKVTNRFFYRDNYNTDDFFAQLNKTLSTTTDLRGLLERVAYEIGHTLKSEQAFFFIYTTDYHYIMAGTPKHKQLPKKDAVILEEAYDKNRTVISASLLDFSDPIRRMMISHKIELILPLIKDFRVIGYLCLGDHLTSGYSNRDIRVLQAISDELIIAIQNALAVQEIREFNTTLQQRIANATKELRNSNAALRQLDRVKDEFISMASHQLRTPLTSVKGYLSMVLEGDAGKISNSQRQLLKEAYISSERMVHLINDFLNVSRIQTGKFIIDKSSVDLSKLVEEEINSLKPNAEGRDLKFVYKKPRKFPLIDVDEGKMRQVVMNFADNAIYYSHENSIITISLSVENNNIIFTVKDAGIGVPKKERAHLFSKFYRASNAKVQRPDGTGVGIYLAKKVVDAHGGQIIFESVEGKGSTFGFRLPIPPQD